MKCWCELCVSFFWNRQWSHSHSKFIKYRLKPIVEHSTFPVFFYFVDCKCCLQVLKMFLLKKTILRYMYMIVIVNLNIFQKWAACCVTLCPWVPPSPPRWRRLAPLAGRRKWRRLWGGNGSWRNDLGLGVVNLSCSVEFNSMSPKYPAANFFGYVCGRGIRTITNSRR